MIGVYTRCIDHVWFGVACDEDKVFATALAPSEKRALQDLARSIPIGLPSKQSETASAFAERVFATLKDIYDGKETPVVFSLATDHLSGHTRRVMEAVSLIPLGYVATYGSVARVAGGSPRSVGGVMASNRFVPIVPCHRVVGSDFSLVGYGGGLDMKRGFLKRESRGFASKLEIPFSGRKLRVFPAEFALEKVSKK